MFSEFFELLLELGALFQLNVLFVSHLNQESFDPREPLTTVGRWRRRRFQLPERCLQLATRMHARHLRGA